MDWLTGPEYQQSRVRPPPSGAQGWLYQTYLIPRFLLFGHSYSKGLERRLEELSGCFAVEVADFSVLDNYLHVGMLGSGYARVRL
jgi:hypothetical protein